MALILAIESSGLVASVAIANEEKIIGEYTVNLKLTHSQTLLPMCEELVGRTGIQLSEVDAIAVSGGPGSFTGLRIGSATAKGLGFAAGKPIVAVPTTQTLAANIFGFEGVICPLMDARRNQVYTGLYRNTGSGFQIVKEQTACMIEDIISSVNEEGKPVIFLGDGVPVFEKALSEKITVPFQFAPTNNNVQRAASLAVRALELYKEGKAVDAADHMPDYLRLSQAEREKAEAQG